MKDSPIFILICGFLILFSLGGFVIFHVASVLIHLLLVFAVISLIFHFIHRSAAP